MLKLTDSAQHSSFLAFRAPPRAITAFCGARDSAMSRKRPASPLQDVERGGGCSSKFGPAGAPNGDVTTSGSIRGNTRTHQSGGSSCDKMRGGGLYPSAYGGPYGGPYGGSAPGARACVRRRVLIVVVAAPALGIAIPAPHVCALLGPAGRAPSTTETHQAGSRRDAAALAAARRCCASLPHERFCALPRASRAPAADRRGVPHPLRPTPAASRRPRVLRLRPAHGADV